MRKVAKPILELSNICKKGKSGVIERLDLSIPSGDSFAVVCTDSENAALLTDIIAGKTAPGCPGIRQPASKTVEVYRVFVI